MWFFNRKVEKIKIICERCKNEFEKYPAFYGRLCDKCLEIKTEEERVKREASYCKDREHNYLGIYHQSNEIIVWKCSKCGKENL